MRQLGPRSVLYGTYLRGLAHGDCSRVLVLLKGTGCLWVVELRPDPEERGSLGLLRAVPVVSLYGACCQLYVQNSCQRVRDHRKSIMTYSRESGLPFGGTMVLHLLTVADVDYRRWMSYEW